MYAIRSYYDLYLASLTNYYTFYLMHHFGLDAQAAQYHLFVFLFAVAAGTVLGGPIGDRVGRKRVIWFSILGVSPFTMLLPHADLFWTTVLSFIIGFILARITSYNVCYTKLLRLGIRQATTTRAQADHGQSQQRRQRPLHQVGSAGVWYGVELQIGFAGAKQSDDSAGEASRLGHGATPGLPTGDPTRRMRSGPRRRLFGLCTRRDLGNRLA